MGVLMSPDPRPELGEFAAPQWTRTELCRLLRDCLRATRPPGAPPVRVGTDVPFYYDPADRLARVTPDLHVIEGMGYEEQLRCYRVWERGRAPQLVVHLVEAALTPEDGLMMHFYRLGAEDVVLYDPLWHMQPATSPSGRRLLSHYRRGAHKLELQRQEHPGRVHLQRWGLWLSHRGGMDLRIYVGEGAAFPPESACWPTAEERAHDAG